MNQWVVLTDAVDGEKIPFNLVNANYIFRNPADPETNLPGATTIVWNHPDLADSMVKETKMDIMTALIENEISQGKIGISTELADTLKQYQEAFNAKDLLAVHNADRGGVQRTSDDDSGQGEAPDPPATRLRTRTRRTRR